MELISEYMAEAGRRQQTTEIVSKFYDRKLRLERRKGAPKILNRGSEYHVPFPLPCCTRYRTGFGLLITFVAILVALRDVNIDKNNDVQGLPNLIGGLSGKFVSSIAALLAATVHALIEKPNLNLKPKPK